MYKMRKCEKRFDVRFYSLRTASLFNFCLSCYPFYWQRSLMPFILPMPAKIGVGNGDTYPKNSLKNISAGNYYLKFGHFSGKNRVRFRNIVT